MPHKALRAHNGPVFERFTDRARRVVVLAQEEARLLGHDYIGTEHLLLGLLRESDGVAGRTLDALGISLPAVRARVEEIIGRSSEPLPGGQMPFTPRAKKVLELSLREAINLGHNYIGTEHLLLGLIREGEGVAPQVLVGMGAELTAVRRMVVTIVEGIEGGTPAQETISADPQDELIRSLREENLELRREVERLREALRRLGEDPDPPVA
jgi:ATP-dependent Clp protease ATP-binding subunit ClpC